MRPWLVCLLIVGCDSNAAPPSGTPPPAHRPPAATLVKDAATLDAHPATLPGPEMYVALCAPCHGKNLEGYKADNAPSLATQTFLESATDGFLKAAITTGRPGTSMAAYGDKLGGPLDDAAVTRLVAFLRSHGPPAKSLPEVAKGDPAKGEVLYVKNCKTCHGDAETRGEALHLANLLFAVQATDPFIKYAIVNGRPGTKMVSFTGVLTDPQINDVISYVRLLSSGAKFAGMLPPPTGKEPLVLNPRGTDPVWKLREDRFVSVDDAQKSYKARAKMIIIDARPPSDWMRAHIKGAVSIPYHDMTRLKDIPMDTWVVTYCACPHHLSGIVADELIKLGHKKVAVLDEGINDWHRKGYPMVAAEGVTAPAAATPPPP